MGLESATYISQLIATNPVGAVDDYATADDHLRLIKGVLQNQFPNFVAAAVNPTDVELNLLVGLLASAAELNALDGYTGNTADLNVMAGAAAAGLTPAEMAFLNGVTSAIQTQLDAKALSARQIISGVGLQGGGDLTGDRTLDFDLNGMTMGAGLASVDVLAYYDDDAAVNRKIALSVLEAFLSHANIAGVVANEHVDHSSVTLSGGTGISSTGLGDLTANRTINAEDAAEGTKGVAQIATQAEVDTGTNDTKMVTPAKLDVALVGGAGITKVKTADKNITSNTNEEDDNHLFGWALDVNSIYKMQGYIYYEQDGGNFRFGFSIDSGFHEDDVHSFTVSDASALHLGATVDLTSGSVLVGPADNQRTGMMMMGFIQTHATIPHTVAFEWAQSTSDPDPTTVKAGSWITFTKIAQL
jgi:hypothetical protein